jgi:hypothetical protein
MIIDDLDVKGVTFTPPETDPPLLVDPDAVLALSITLQSLELIRAWNRKVLQVSSRVQLLQLHQRPLLNVAWKTLGVLATPDPLSLPASKGLDHVGILTRRVSNVQRYYIEQRNLRQPCGLATLPVPLPMMSRWTISGQ